MDPKVYTQHTIEDTTRDEVRKYFQELDASLQGGEYESDGE